MKLANLALSMGFLAVALGPWADSARGQGAVAFQPNVGAIPDGVSVGVTPVVSADRRYVRLTVNAGFQTVNGFNTLPVPGAVGGGPGGPGALGGLGGGLGGLGGGGGGGGAGGGGRILGGFAGMDGFNNGMPAADRAVFGPGNVGTPIVNEPGAGVSPFAASYAQYLDVQSAPVSRTRATRARSARATKPAARKIATPTAPAPAPTHNPSEASRG